MNNRSSWTVETAGVFEESETRCVRGPVQPARSIKPIMAAVEAFIVS
jgi:hypothetical protein